MILPDEIVAARFAPTFRALLSRSLLARGLSQQAVASLLGLTQGAVSKQAASDRDLDPALAQDPRVLAAVSQLSDDMAAGRASGFEALAETIAVVRALETRGPICALHEEAMPSLAGLGCDLCVRLGRSPVREEQDVLGNVREAVRILESSSRFASRMPGVGSNVAMALAGASGREGVAAIPGGLFEMKGAVKAPAPPEFGVSKHVATVLLGAHARRPSIRGCVNVAASAEFERAARAARCGIVPLPAEEERDAQAVASRVGRVPPKRRVDVLWQAGAFGVEPTAYVVGSSAVDAVRKALSLLGEESAAAARGREKTGGASPKARNPRGAPGAGAVTRPRGAPRRRAGKSSR